MTNSTETLTFASPISDILKNKSDVQTLVKFLDIKGFKTESVNVPIYERLALFLKNCDTIGTHHN
ncbi:MAG TPA: hypothetical protein VNF68_05950 [Candidatus Baltobacteraceae bacterium]|nr:hypothetical protein [Candidatus Baltobacteraceae bacterium]